MLCFPKGYCSNITSRILIVLLLSALMITAGPAAADTAPEVTPASEDMQEEDAIQYAESVLYEHFDVEDGFFDTASTEAFFGVYDASIDESIWMIEFTVSETGGVYRVKMYRNGNLISYAAPSSQSYATGEDELTGATFATPGSYDISQEEAIEFAELVIGEIGDYETRMDSLTAEAYFIYSERFNSGWEPVWIIYFYQDDTLVQKVLLGYEGSYISTASGDKQFDSDSRTRETYYPYEFSEVPFFEMSLEERAAVTAEWLVYVNEAIETYPYYPAPGDLVYEATRYVYGVPDENNISQEEATAIARKAIIAMGANEETISSRRIEYRFDITDETKPLWKIIFFSPTSVSDDVTKYRVVIDANTAEVIETLFVDSDTPITEYRF